MNEEVKALIDDAMKTLISAKAAGLKFPVKINSELEGFEGEIVTEVDVRILKGQEIFDEAKKVWDEEDE